MKYLSTYDLKSLKPILSSSLFIYRDIIDLASVNYQTYGFYDKIVTRRNYGINLVKSAPRNNSEGFRQIWLLRGVF